jgi:hypothetical protein
MFSTTFPATFSIPFPATFPHRLADRRSPSLPLDFASISGYDSDVMVMGN